MSSGSWYCDGCGRINASVRYQCEQCRGFNTYDLCDQCIVRAQALHPNHSFKLVGQVFNGIPVINRTVPYYYSWAMISSPQYVPLRQPTVRISYEY
ncbi:unnamed protein product [Rotaria sp. Silwood2]|nr:unnamed protein product [Rotaria sp. Silwood2]CAF3133594.1 unnamed protein product [Rotaria sp. Silwood2]CAF3401463.1 unnamed protein product [Rotaria sp. Silwood2]CAF4133475.1 unnamed protein product [Rotaria sp. Silwood2]CAF4502959.1 unnamed protein product [Rotaria sp. Silwood2]